MHYPDRVTVCVSSQAGCAMGVRVLRHRPGRLRPPPHHRRDRRAGRAGRRSGPAATGGGCRTSCSWAWASRSPTTTARGPPSSACTTTSASRPATSRSRPSASCPASAASPASALPVNLAVSLHAANDELRDELVPINRRYPLDDAGRRLRQRYLAAKGRRLSFEWALIDGVNDRDARRQRAGRLSPRPLRAHVNLIPLNPTPGWPTRGTPPAQVRRVPRPADGARRERDRAPNRGTDIDAACGQLAASASGLSRPVTFVRPSTGARSSRLRILPEPVLGSSSHARRPSAGSCSWRGARAA